MIRRIGITVAMAWVGLSLGTGLGSVADANVGFTCEGPPPENVTDNTCTVGPGQTFDILVVLDSSVTDLRGISLVMEYDPTCMAVDSTLGGNAVSPGPLWASGSCDPFLFWLNAEDGSDSLAVDVAGLGCSVAGEGKIIRVGFQAKLVTELCVSDITCRSMIMRDSLNQDIPCSCDDFSVVVIPPVVVEPTTWGLLKSRYSGEE